MNDENGQYLSVYMSVILLTTTAHAQFGNGIVFDPTQSGHAIEQIRQAQQMYTTAEQTRTTVISAYNLARQMANLPNSLYQRYATPWTIWRNVSAGNTYGNVQGWVNAANTGLGAILGYQAATINVTPRYPLYQQLSPAEPTDCRLTGGNHRSWVTELLKATSKHWARCEQTLKRGSPTSGRWRLRHTQTTQHSIPTWRPCSESTKQHLCSFGPSKTQIRFRQAAALQQMVSQKQQQDALKAAFEDAAEYQQQYNSTVQPLTSGIGNYDEPDRTEVISIRREEDSR